MIRADETPNTFRFLCVRKEPGRQSSTEYCLMVCRISQDQRRGHNVITGITGPFEIGLTADVHEWARQTGCRVLVRVTMKGAAHADLV